MKKKILVTGTQKGGPPIGDFLEIEWTVNGNEMTKRVIKALKEKYGRTAKLTDWDTTD